MKEDTEPKDISRIFITESRNNPISRGEYLNPRVGDLTMELIQDVHKCIYFTNQKDKNLSAELQSVLQGYCDFVVENWTALEKGSYHEITKRPDVTFKQFLTEEIVKDNIPELSQEEKVLLSMETMEVPKGKSSIMTKGASQGSSEFKMLDA